MMRSVLVLTVIGALLAPASFVAAQGTLDPAANPFATKRRQPRQPAQRAEQPAEPAQDQPAQDQPAQAQPAQAQPAQDEAQPEPAQEAPAQTRPARAQPAAQAQPAQAQLAQDEAQADEAQADEAQADEPASPAQAIEAQDEPLTDEELDEVLDQALGTEDFGGEADETLVEEGLEHEVEALPGNEHELVPAIEGADEAPPGAEHDEAHGEEHHGFDVMGFLPVVVNFLLLLAILTLLLRKPLTEFLKNRRLAVLEGLEESKRLKEAAEAKYKEYSERLEHLDEELEKLRKEMIQAGEAERDRIIAEAESRAARMRKDAQFVIDQQMKQLRADLTREAIEAAIAAAGAVLAEQTSAADQQKLADAYLGKLSDSIKDEEVRA